MLQRSPSPSSTTRVPFRHKAPSRLRPTAAGPPGAADRRERSRAARRPPPPRSRAAEEPDVVKALVFEAFVTGGETVTVTVEWAMAELLKNPRAMVRVRSEIDAALGGKHTIDESDAMRLPYLMAVVKEAMRLHPVAPVLVPHQAVEKGVERFLDAEVAGYRGKHFEYLPFGSGRRQCPGLPMAERVMPHLLASLLHAFEWRLPDGMSVEQLDVSERFTTANVLAVPLKAVPIVHDLPS